MLNSSLLENRAMFVSAEPWFAASDANLLALAAIAIVGLLVWEFVRERLNRRRKRKAERARNRSRKNHWGYT